MENARKNVFSGSGMTRRSFVVGMSATAIASMLGLSACGAPSTVGDSSNATAEDYDIVIVGAGGAGMCAAIAAFDAGIKNLVILEKASMVGGNTSFSSSGMNASETKFQKEQGIEDSNELFAQETLDGGHNTGDPELVDFMCDHSAGTIDWLDGLGIRLDNITSTGGMSVKRCHRPTDGSPVGATVVPGLEAQVKDRDIKVVKNCQVKSLIVDDSGVVIGVMADNAGSETTYNAKAVILATGGLGSNKELIAKYRPDLKDYASTNQPAATGDGYVMAEEAGAELVQMDQIQIHPTVGLVEGADGSKPAPLIAEAVRGGGAILVNQDGKRFFDEMSTRDKVSAAELEQPGGYAWEVFDQTVYDNNKAVKNYDSQGLVVTGSDLADLASKIGVDADTLKATVDAYNAITAEGKEDEFGRTKGCIEFVDGNYYAIKVSPGVHHEMGGIKINTSNEALRADGTKIDGLYAAGEVTGGIHGNNRIGGNAVCDVTTFGRNVGDVVAEAIA